MIEFESKVKLEDPTVIEVVKDPEVKVPVVKVPAAGVVPPITLLSIVPPDMTGDVKVLFVSV